MFSSSFEVIVLLLDVEVMTFLYPLLRFQAILKDWNATESFAFEDVIV